MKKTGLLGLLAAALLISGCMLTVVSTNGQLTIGAAEKWDLFIDIVIPSESAQLYGDALIQQLQGSTQDLEAKGLQVETELSDVDEEGNVTLHVHTHGQGYALLDEQLGSNGSISVEEIRGKKILYLEMYDLVDGVITQKDSTFTIQGGKVLETNGNRINATTVEWINPTSMQVSMEEPGAVNPLGIVLIVLGGLCILFAIAWQMGWFRKKTVPAPAPVILDVDLQPAPSAASRYCGRCGTSLSSQAKFCPKCGAKVE